MLNEKLIRIESTDEDKEKATKRESHFTDSLHAVLAIRANVDYFITRNVTDFSGFRHELKIKLPESL